MEDLAKFAVAQFDPSNKALYLTQKKTFESPEGLGIGLGWHLPPAPSGDVWHWHNGGTGGYTSSMVLDVEEKNAVILLSNVSAYHPDMNNIDALSFGLMESLEEE